MPSPLVSVVMAVRDGEHFLDQTIESVRTQTLEDFEFIIVNDGSTDTTPEILAAYARRDPRVVVLHVKREGLIAALRRGIDAVRAPFLARIDADDIATPERLFRQVERMEHEPELGLLGGQAYIIDEQGRPLGLRTPPTDHETLIVLLARINPFIQSTVMLRTELVRAIGGYRPAFELAEDYDLWLRLSEHSRIANLAEPLVHYRVHNRSETSSKTLRLAFLARLARRAAEERRTGRPDPFDGFTTSPGLRRVPPDACYAADARDFRLLELYDADVARNLNLAGLDPAILDGLPRRLDHGERKLAQRALLNLLKRDDRPNGFGWLRLFALLVRLHPARAITILARGLFKV